MLRCKHARRFHCPAPLTQRSRPICLRSRPFCLQTRQFRANSRQDPAGPSLPVRQPFACDAPHKSKGILGRFSAFQSRRWRLYSSYIAVIQRLRRAVANFRVSNSLPFRSEPFAYEALSYFCNFFVRNYLRRFCMQLIANKDRALKNVNFRSTFARAKGRPRLNQQDGWNVAHGFPTFPPNPCVPHTSVRSNVWWRSNFESRANCGKR